MSGHETNIATVQRFWDSISRGDVEGYLSTFAPDGVAYDPADQPPMRTSEERRTFLQGLLNGFQELKARIDYITHCGDSTAAKWTMNGRTLTGEDVEIQGIDIYNHDSRGLLTEMRGYFVI